MNDALILSSASREGRIFFGRQLHQRRIGQALLTRLLLGRDLLG